MPTRTIKTIIIILLTFFFLLLILKFIPTNKEQGEANLNSTTTVPFSNTPGEGFELYTNTIYKFSLIYPITMTLVPKDQVVNLDGLDSRDIFIRDMSRETFSGTNLNEVRIIAGAKNSDPNTCTNIIYGNNVKSYDSFFQEQIKINDYVFNKTKVREAGVGNIFDTTRYSTYQQGICYELLAVAKSTNLLLIQETDPTIKQYDESLFIPLFEHIVASFKFVI
jgi:hypothetical protein